MEKINVAELLENCPKGMKLYTTVWGDVEFIKLLHDVGMIKVLPTSNPYNTSNTKLLYFDGSYTLDGECILFPSKENRDWGKFHKPFKDGDIVTFPTENHPQIFIFKDKKENNILSSCYLMLDGDELVLGEDLYYVTRHATEEEKRKLFDAIKTNGYKWNPETKTLENLIEPNIKDGDIIYTKTKGDSKWLSIYKELEGHNLRTYANISLDNNLCFYCNRLTCNILCSKEEISEQRLATEEEKQKLFQVIKDNGYKWNPETKTMEFIHKFKVGDKVKSIFNNCQYTITELNDTHYTLVEVINKFKYIQPIIDDKYLVLVPDKFDINTLKPYDKVLVRCGNNGTWVPQFFAKYKPDSKFPFVCTYNSWSQCVPYKNNEYLYDTTNNCNEYYKIWEE